MNKSIYRGRMVVGVVLSFFFWMKTLTFSTLLAAELPAVGKEEPTIEQNTSTVKYADLNEALLGAGKSGKPILLLVRNAQNIGTLDAAHWLRDPALQKNLEAFELLTVWKEHPSLKTLQLPKQAELVLLTSKAAILASIEVPPLRALFKIRLEELAKNPSVFSKNEVKENVELFAKEHPESWQALRQTYVQSVRDYAKFHDDNKVKTAFLALLAAPIPPEEMVSCVGLFTQALLQFDFDDARQAVAQRLEREWPVGRAAADVFLDLADIAFEKNQRAEAVRLYTLAEKASDKGESPTLYRAARAMRHLIEGKNSPNQSLWAKRDVRDGIVIVEDYGAYLDAIGQWTDREFWPVLFADDLFAPKFIAAFKPSHVVFVPASSSNLSHRCDDPDFCGAVPSIEAIRRVLFQSWSSDSEKEKIIATEMVSNEDLRLRLKKLITPALGVVFGEGKSGEMAGAIALAAGRFQGLEILPCPSLPSLPTNGMATNCWIPQQLLPQADAEVLASKVIEGLHRWGFPQDDRWATVTLAGCYPFRYTGVESAWGYGTNYALDDLIGRDENRSRIAVTSRLMGSASQSAYQAMCSLFLQPETALLFNTYKSDPMLKSAWSYYRLNFLEDSLKSRLHVSHLQNDQSRVENFRTHVLPWNRNELMWINSTGGPYQWSISGGKVGEGCAEDMPVGVPSAMVMIHSNSASELYDPESIVGRALWGGAYWYSGAVSEPLLTAFQPARYAAPRILAGAPFAAVFSQRASQNFFLPWRLMKIGDPQFCLRDKPVRRLPMAEILNKFPKSADIQIPSKCDTQLRKMSAKFDVSCKPDEFTRHIRKARLLGNSFLDGENFLEQTDEKLLDGIGAAMALEELLKAGHTQKALTLWCNLSQQSQKNETALRMARLAAGVQLDKMIGVKNFTEACIAFKIVLTTKPAKNFTERWTLRLESLAVELKTEAEWKTWKQENNQKP